MSEQLTFFAPIIPIRPSDWPEDYQTQFWLSYPVKISKRTTMLALDKAKDRGAKWTALMDGVARYTKWLKEPHWRPNPKHPTTWLNQNCWEDELPSGGLNGQTTTAQRARRLASRAAELERSHGIERTAQPVGSTEHRR